MHLWVTQSPRQHTAPLGRKLYIFFTCHTLYHNNAGVQTEPLFPSNHKEWCIHGSEVVAATPIETVTGVNTLFTPTGVHSHPPS